METILQNLQIFLQKHPDGIIIITGPTASGKTGISLQIAEFLKRTTKGEGEIINADSRQIFKEIPITTAAPTKEEKKDIPHHLFEFLSPNKKLNVSEWKSLAEKKIKEIQKRGNTPLLCGGTGLYINALVNGFSLAESPPNKKLRIYLEGFSSQDLWEKLHKCDPESAEKIHPNNKKYIIRTLEIYESHHQPKSQVIKRLEAPFPLFFLGVTLPRDILYKKINTRVEKMFEMGFLEECKNIMEKYPQIFISSYEGIHTSSQISLDGANIAHGIPEGVAYLKGEISLEELKEKMKQNTRNYAKRQLTWWRRNKNIHWINGETGNFFHDFEI